MSIGYLAKMQILIQVWVGAWESVFSTDFQVMLMLFWGLQQESSRL